MKIAVAVSGGVDSLYALLSLKEQGHDVLALHARFIDSVHDPVPNLQKACDKMGIPLYVVDLQRDFNENVILPFLKYYKNAQTPNPCALCNKSMKFGKLLEKARELGAEKLATGHYVKLADYCNELTAEWAKDFGLCIQCAEDLKKDQSYFLALTPLENLRSALFPLSHKSKEEIKEEIARKNIEIPCPKESQEVCFVPNDDYRSFLLQHDKVLDFSASCNGEVHYMDTNARQTRKIASHKGLWAYTEGQRMGLGIAWSEPLYVIKRDPEKNILYVGNKNAINTKYALAGQINFLVPPTLWHGQLYARTRFREKQSPCKVYLKNIKEEHEVFIENPVMTTDIEIFMNNSVMDDIRIFVEFTEEKQIYAAGQILAIYDERGFLLAGGILI